MVWSDDGSGYLARRSMVRNILRVEVPALGLPAHPLLARRPREASLRFTAACRSTPSGCARSAILRRAVQLTARPGHLRLYGRETLGSLFRQSLVARRQQAHCYTAVTSVDFAPEEYQQVAGLICYYNASKFHYLHISHEETVGAISGSCRRFRIKIAGGRLHHAPVLIPGTAPVHLRAELDHAPALLRL